MGSNKTDLRICAPVGAKRPRRIVDFLPCEAGTLLWNHAKRNLCVCSLARAMAGGGCRAKLSFWCADACMFLLFVFVLLCAVAGRLRTHVLQSRVYTDITFLT